MRTLYVTDLDGTLLNSNDKINQYSINVINSLVDKGMIFTFATARSLVSASVVTKGLSVNIPAIVYNGACIINPSTNEILTSVNLAKEDIDKAVEVINKYDISPLVYSYINGAEKVSWVAGRENEGLKRYLNSRQGDKRLRALDDDRNLYDGDMFYFTCIGEKEELLPAYEILSHDKHFTCTLQQELYRTEYWLEIMPKKATKAEAIKTLKDIWNCDRVVSFGDAINDISMFQISDECYAMKNAVDELKDIATGVIDSNDEDGVARWLQAHVESSLI